MQPLTAEEILEDIKAEDGMVDVDQGLDLLRDAINELDVTITSADVLNLTALRLDVLTEVMVDLLVTTQEAFITSSNTVLTALGGDAGALKPYDPEREATLIRGHLNLQNTMNLFNYLSLRKERNAETDGDDSGAVDPVEEGRSGEDDAEADTVGQDG